MNTEQQTSTAPDLSNTVLAEYTSFRSIKQFPHANYKVNVAWEGVKRFINEQPLVNLDPDYQRGYVWTQQQKERFMEYRLMGGMSGKIIYWNCPNWMDNQGTTIWHDTIELVDGKQRINCVLDFLENKVKVFGKYMNEYIDPEYVRRIKFDFEFHINVLSSKKEVIEWYLGLNNGGSVHTEDDLNIARSLL